MEPRGLEPFRPQNQRRPGVSSHLTSEPDHAKETSPMHGFTDCTFPSSRNAFSSSFLQRVGERDEPPTAGEADAAGPWHVAALPAGEGFGLFRAGESGERGFRPAVVFRQRPLALLAAAVLPGTGRDAAFRLRKEAGASGFAIEAGSGGEVVG